jgi:hypothetical protein
MAAYLNNNIGRTNQTDRYDFDDFCLAKQKTRQTLDLIRMNVICMCFSLLAVRFHDVVIRRSKHAETHQSWSFCSSFGRFGVRRVYGSNCLMTTRLQTDLVNPGVKDTGLRVSKTSAICRVPSPLSSLSYQFRWIKVCSGFGVQKAIGNAYQIGKEHIKKMR